ncbi:glycosyltransferase family 4 protein [Winogradskyella ouciana]|uniref:Glycosyltransferase n=1 Tax=Winogradskyella ouciana TaxID=2608631 RepID=A0A7K1GB62_9FLAO|nr:glycosyltransferase family 4 protein [Winogradskyella ouciana]MTE26540.1 glycosyltransferase [Winogradskyella ouciana]
MNKSGSIFCFVQLYHISEQGGGAEVQSNYLAAELARRGCVVHYICKTINPDKIGTVSKINGTIIHWIENRPTHSKSSIKEIYKILQIVNPEYIIERMSSAFGLAIIKYRQKYNCKYIWICTDNHSALKYKNVIQTYQKLNLIKFSYALRKSIYTDLIRQKAIRICDYVFIQNKVQKSLIQKNFNKKAFNMISGHPLSKSITSISERLQDKVVLWCANLGKHKRPELFVALASQMQHTNLKFVMVGGHSDKSYVKKLFANKPHNLIVTGQLSFSKALDYFNSAFLLVNTSISEGFSNTYIQAWLRGVPTLVFGADPNDVMVQNEIGYNVHNIKEAENNILSLLNNEILYKMIASNAYNYAKHNHSIKTMTDNFLKSINN